MNKELLLALEMIEKEKNISKDVLLEAIENSLLTACKNHFGKADNVKVTINPDTCDFSVVAEKEVVERWRIRCRRSVLKKQSEEPAIHSRRHRAGADSVQGVRQNRHPECKECDFAEDP